MHTQCLASALGTALAALTIFWPADSLRAEPSETISARLDTLIVVNGEPITSREIDDMIMKSHARLDMSQETDALLARLLEKAVNDRLILQDAVAMGLHQDPEVLGPVTESSFEREIALFVRDNFVAPREVSQEAVREYFQQYYHRIHLRQLSVRTREELDAVVARIEAGEDMGAIAEELSLDSKKIHGGLHNFKYWADVEVPLRDASRDLVVGGLSEPFAYNEAWAVVRVEDRESSDLAELPEFENTIRARILAAERDAAWIAFVDSLLEISPVQTMPNVVEALREDGEDVFKGSFRRGSDQAALVLDDTHQLDESGLREATSRAAMEMGDRPFEEILDFTIARQSERLVLKYNAEKAGYAEKPEMIAAFDRELEDLMLKSYINETVVQRIKFNHAELDSFYEAHKDDFRGPDEVRLAFIFFDDIDQANSVAERLSAGADWGYVKKEVEGAGHGSENTKFAPLKMFSDPVIAAVEDMDVGQTSEPIVFNGRWMVLRLEGRRPGDPMPRSEVEMPVRNAVFQRKFQTYLDEQLDLLKERSEIVRFEDRIRKYLASES